MQRLHQIKETGRWSGNIQKNPEVPHNLKIEYKVRTFPIFNFPENTENLFLGSSLIKNLVNIFSIPQDICIHAYRYSTTKKGVAVLAKYPEKELKTVVLQNRNNSILKQKHQDMNERFYEYFALNLLSECLTKFSANGDPTNHVIKSLIYC